MYNVSKKVIRLSGIFFRFLLIFIFPLILIFYFVYSPLSPNECFSLQNASALYGEDNPQIKIVRQDISDYLDKEIKSIQLLDPILPLSDRWFKFDVFFKNNLKVALVVTKPESYTEATTTFLIQTQYGSSTISYNQETRIAEDKRSDELINLINSFGFITNNKPIIVGPHEYVSLQTNPGLGQICVRVILGKKYVILFYLECLIIFIGFLVLFKEAFKFIGRSFKRYFVSDLN